MSTLHMALDNGIPDIGTCAYGKKESVVCMCERLHTKLQPNRQIMVQLFIAYYPWHTVCIKNL